MKTEADRQRILGEEGCVGRGRPYTGRIDFGGNGPPVETQIFWIERRSQLQRQHPGNQVSFINPAPNVIIWYKTELHFSSLHLPLQEPSPLHGLCSLSPRLPGAALCPLSRVAWRRLDAGCHT